MACRLLLLLLCTLLGAGPGPAQAAELGEPRVSSFIGQPLVADIELIMLEDAAAPVRVRLAHPDVYHGANVGMPPVLSTLTFSVMRREGRQFLHITSLKPVEPAHLHLYLELVDGAQRSVRLATLWLSPDPQPAPAPLVVAAVPPVVASAAVPEPRQLRMEAPVPAPVRPQPAVVAAPRLARAIAPPPARPVPVPVPAALVALAPAPAACAPQANPEQNTCAVLEAKNAALLGQLDGLEDKVKLLQVAVGAAPTPAAAAGPAAAPIKPKKNQPAAPPQAATPWLLVASAIAGLLLLIAGAVMLWRRSKKGKGGATARHVEPTVPLGARLKARLGGLGKTAKATPAAAAHNSSTQA
ncbi:FimV family protein [Massilia sp. H6]|uniref:type IV pilus assembly protein FimV n=1 Tax=Massilia sp. H6 TaxID=2970464 RepID=UPI00216706A1|nr:hypothetical protein [Massilia sp. H6]UVW29837.1 hypothetical protein NRS07_06865 [Massilia sp. H6]